MMNRYFAFNLAIDSALPLPELLETERTAAAPDVTVRFASGPLDEFAGTAEYAPFLRMGPGKVWLDVPEVARFLINDGRDILIEPKPGAGDVSIRLFLLGSVIGALLSQRDNLVLHGNVIRVGGKAMICVGRSGTGKSTLAAGFMQRGYPVIADDVAAIDRAGLALPGIPRIKLWQETADRLDIGTDSLARVRSDLPKFHLPLSVEAGSQPVPVGWIYVLEPGPVPGVTIETLTGLARFPPLVENTYRLVLVEGMKLTGTHLAQCAALANKVHIARISRPQDVFMLDDLMNLLINDMAAH